MLEAIAGEILLTVAVAFGKKVAEFGAKQVKKWLDQATEALSQPPIGEDNVEQIIKAMQDKQDTGEAILDMQMARRELARWSEVPLEEFAYEQLEEMRHSILICHRYLENLFIEWFKGDDRLTDVEAGHHLRGVEDIYYVADIYGCYRIPSRKFDSAVSLICSRPPSTYRIHALLHALEAYEQARKEQRKKLTEFDAYMFATPFEFGRDASNAIKFQNRRSSYPVIKLEGKDLWNLRDASAPGSRAKIFEEMITAARGEKSQKS